MMKRRLPSSGRHDVGVRGGEECRHHEETEEGNTQRIVCVLFSHKHNKMTSLGSLRVAQKNVLRLVHLGSEVRTASLIGVVLQKNGTVGLLDTLLVRVRSTHHATHSYQPHAQNQRRLTLRHFLLKSALVIVGESVGVPALSVRLVLVILSSLLLRQKRDNKPPQSTSQPDNIQQYQYPLSEEAWDSLSA